MACRSGYLKRHELSMQNIRAWAQNNPDKVDTLLNQNQSFVFFKEKKGGDPNEDRSAPKAFPDAQSSGCSRRRYISLGTPVLVSVSQTNPNLNFTKPVVAQDTAAPSKVRSALTSSGDSEMKRAKTQGDKKPSSRLAPFTERCNAGKPVISLKPNQAKRPDPAVCLKAL